MASKTKGKSTKTVSKGSLLWAGDGFCVVRGELKQGQGRPAKEGRIFQYVGEKLPFDCLRKVKNALPKKKTRSGSKEIEGVYLAHDSMGVVRYGGRGQIFTRLAAHHKKYPRELQYFSFYVINDKGHEREIETVVLRAAGPQMTLNTQKVALGPEPGDVRNYESGTGFFERQQLRGRRKQSRRGTGSAVSKGSRKRR